ncbi:MULTISPECIES: flagellar FlbD family protein [Peribacillus]|uniref:flagellar FlbD family protein n=1 Tax=Peribacillus TaxID=2675229 RepID=UPI002868E409|nr:flagellar FlbD family protein [Peribacillus sp. R9-11]WMX58303.1 flagellar FlbD family protein [Peribacillus sp. R9-11]
MIKVTRLNGKSFHINALYIDMVESLPDSTITFTNGKKIVVLEKEEEIIQAIIQFYRTVNVLGLRDDEEERL